MQPPTPELDAIERVLLFVGQHPVALFGFGIAAFLWVIGIVDERETVAPPPDVAQLRELVETQGEYIDRLLTIIERSNRP